MIFHNKPLMIDTTTLNTVAKFEWTESARSELAYNIYSGVALIPVHGLLTKRPGLFTPFFETTSYEEIHNAIVDAQSHPDISAVLLDIDSPGGEVSGLFDLVDFIHAAKDTRPIYAVANDMAFSAAYAIASATSKIFINRTSGVGSIGVVATHVDVSEADKKDGIKYTTVFAGSKKNDLSPHEPISDDAVSDIQKEVNRLYDMFVATVARNRNLSAELVKATQAATYYGEEAIKNGLADEIVVGNEVLGRVLELGGKMDGEKYKAQVLEIAQLCKLAHAEHKIADFIAQDLSADQVKRQLLDAMSVQQEISNANYQKEATLGNPVIAAAKQRAVASKNSLH